MNILVIAPRYPFYDRSSGDLRILHILKALAPHHRIWFCPLFERSHEKNIGREENLRYKSMLREIGITIPTGGPRQTLRTIQLDIVFFEFYFTALPWLDEVRTLQTNARVVIDSVDVHFHRLNAKALVTQDTTDMAQAIKAKADELSAYTRSDSVIVVTGDDGKLLSAESENIAVSTIPNIHVIHELVAPVADPVLTFVGGFSHEPNTDAVLYFVREVLPLIRAREPEVVFHVIGNAPPAEVQALENNYIKVHGYVPDTNPYLRASRVSVAPLRYGAGMKGKIGEAMALGLPVVTTSVGIEGFGLSAGQNVLVGDTPDAFAQAVLRLLKEDDLYERIRMNGWRFIRDHYSQERVQEQVVAYFNELAALMPKRLPLYRRIVKRLELLMEEQVMWRLKRG